ncbi:MAG TPA: FtsX-like permease family protein, partial [Candidatus Acidoferrales bacterium]|nr:FtsX-like permease family protein [Candidatus Acidoferrales bacterium]
QRLRRVLVVAEVALALVLVVCSGLLLRSFARILDVNPGFDAQNLLTMQLSLPRYKYGNEKQLVQFSEDVLRRVSALPGVTHAALAFEPPLVSGDSSVFAIRGYVPGPGKPEPHADYLDVSADYLATMRIPLLRGRWFTSEDYEAMQKSSNLGQAVVIDQAFAERFWPGADPIGGGIGNSDKGPFATIVGVVATVHGSDLAEESKGTIYIPDYSSGTSLMLRTAGAPSALVNSVREQVAAVDPEQPIYDVQTMEERISQSLARRRFAMVLLAAFAALAFLLALIGLEGVIAYIVTQRTHEIGIRMALGAQRRDVMSDVLGQGIKLAGAGVAIGLIGTALCSRLMASQLFGIPALDWVTYLAASATLIAAASLACYLPALRATRVDPMIALRYE